MRIECIAIGTELLTTERLDTNSVWLAQRLAELGLAFHRKTVAGDDPADLRALFREAPDRSDLVICTGGLGPTFDDLTKEIWAEILGARLVEDPATRKTIEDFFAARNRALPATNLKQALIPEGALVLRNALGTAPGIYWESVPGHPGKRVVLLQGVPREMKAIWTEQIEPWLRDLAGRPIQTLRMLVGSEGESALDARTTPLRQKHGHLEWTILAGLGQVELIARSASQPDLDAALEDFRSELGDDLAGVGSVTLEGIVADHLLRRGETLAVAESMTGGMIQTKLTGIPGVSRVFKGGAVTYCGEAKRLLAGVDESVLREHGTVSEATSRALAEGIRERLGSTWSLAVTGNAGPSEDPEGPAPVGTCVMAVSGPGGTTVRTWTFPGARTDIQARSALWTLDFLRRHLLR